MSTKIRYRDEPLGEIRVVPDFLPSPAELAFRDEGVKVTLALSRKSVDFFKAEASRHYTQYQRMIRGLLDAYVESQLQNLLSRSPRAAGRRPSSAMLRSSPLQTNRYNVTEHLRNSEEMVAYLGIDQKR